MLNLGLMYFKGDGVSRDPSNAMRYFEIPESAQPPAKSEIGRNF